MPKNGEIKIKHGSSSLSEFVERALPTDEEVEAFDNYAVNEAKDEEIKASLENIYRDEKGVSDDVRKLTIKKQRGWFFNLFNFIVVLFVIGAAAYASYNYIYLKIVSSRSTVSLSFDAPKEIAAGQEFYYDLNYKNEDNVAINLIEIKATYPDNFIFLDADPEPNSGNNTWNIPKLDSHRSDIIKIKGKLVAPLDSSNIILADMTYMPANFSSEFKKSASWEIKINDLGLDLSFVNSSSALINEANEIDIKFKVKELNYLGNFRLSLEHPDEVSIETAPATSSAPAVPTIKAESGGSWLISNLGKNENEFKLKFMVKEKKQPQISLKLKFELPYLPASGEPKYYLFFEKDLVYDIIKSDLNINLISNGSPLDQGVNFGQTLNYTVSYKDTGDTTMKDVIIMAILESDFLDWLSLSDKNDGPVSGNTISWSKSEIPALANLPAGGEGIIDFSIKLKQPAAIDLTKAYQVKSYVKYSIAGKSAAGDSQSNIIISKINSDLNFGEQVRYFSDDNIAVGSGPLPPKVGQTTSLKIYWTLNNTLHDLNNLSVSASLPANVSWGGKNRTSVGSLYYDSQSNKVIWQIGALQASSYNASAEFNLELTPQESNRNKIMIILPGSTVSAVDSFTGAPISQTLKAKTTKLEDDNLANTDGIVQ